MSISELLSIAGPIAALVVALIGVIWSMLNKRIDGLESNMNQSFTAVADQIRSERKEMTRIIEKDRDKFMESHDELSKDLKTLLIEVTKLTAKSERE